MPLCSYLVSWQCHKNFGVTTVIGTCTQSLWKTNNDVKEKKDFDSLWNGGCSKALNDQKKNKFKVYEYYFNKSVDLTMGLTIMPNWY